MIKYGKRVGIGCHQNGRGYREQLLQGLPVLEKGVRPPRHRVLDPGAYSHVHTHKHTTHLGTGTAKGITANGEVHVTTLNTACSAEKKG